MDSLRIERLDKQTAKARIKEILNLEQFVNNVGGPNWTEENLMKELPQKWDLSFLILKDSKIIGYVIASNRNECYHVHRPFLSLEYRNILTYFLIKTILRKAEEFRFKEVSWKSGTRIVGFEASRRLANREEYVGNWDNSDFYYFYKKV